MAVLDLSPTSAFTSCVPSLSLSFLICKMRIKLAHTFGVPERTELSSVLCRVPSTEGMLHKCYVMILIEGDAHLHGSRFVQRTCERFPLGQFLLRPRAWVSGDDLTSMHLRNGMPAPLLLTTSKSACALVPKGLQKARGIGTISGHLRERLLGHRP